MYTKADREQRQKWLDEKCEIAEGMLKLLDDKEKNIHLIIHQQIKGEMLMLKVLAMDIRYNVGIGISWDVENITHENLFGYLKDYQSKIRPFEVDVTAKGWRKEDE